MPLQKQPININFSQGLDTKTDPFQIPVGKFQTLTNSVFTKGGLLQKRNGFGSLPSLPDSSSVLLSTFNGDLTAIGTSLQAYSEGSGSWVNKGSLQPVQLSTSSLIRNSVNQTQVDSVIAPNGLICTVYTENNGSSLSYKYAVADSVTGQNVVAPTALPAADPTYGTPRVFVLGFYFIVLYARLVSAAQHLSFIAISSANPTVVTSPADISTSYGPSPTVNFDATSVNNTLFIAWNGASSSGLKMTYMTTSLVVASSVIIDAGIFPTQVSVCSDTSTSTIWVTYYDGGSGLTYAVPVNTSLHILPGPFPVQLTASTTILNIATAAQSSSMTLFYEVSNVVNTIQTNFIKSISVTQAGVTSSTSTIKRSVGLASKAFVLSGKIYVLSTYSSTYQPTYFLLDYLGNIVAKVAYQNGGGYIPAGLPYVTVDGSSATVAYLIKDLIQSVNKGTNLSAGTQTAGIYAQTGINSVTFVMNTSSIVTAEIGTNLNITGGFLWAYDGYSPVEQEFFLYPDSIQATWSATGGSMAAKPDGSTNTNAYFYQVTYEWSDNQGNLFRSAPSIPVAVTTTGSASTGSVSIKIPTLRLTYKTANPVKIVVYRWSVAQQSYYQTTSITTPVLNDTTTDSVTFLDTNADATILGNNLIYTTGGVLENIGPPACSTLTLFQSRLFLVDAEDRNLLWYSKQVIENTPVEMSDLLTMFVAPTAGAQGSTGPITALSAMDDKLIIFKMDAIYYMNGQGPDNTGANSQFSDPIFITATVGSINQNSIVFMPQGLMFQSDKGIWLLGRDLSTTYIGAPVESYTDGATVLSALNIPATNQVRFTMSSGVTLMYDYYYAQWGTFSNIAGISSTLFESMHTYLNSLGQIFQETPGTYMDGSSPVLMSFTTGWLNLAGLQGFERGYYFNLLGTYLTPHKLVLAIAYDYNPSPTQSTIISPDNYGAPWGREAVWGSGPNWGGPGNIEQWRVFLQRQKCQAFQIALNEQFDATFGTAPGAGLTLSGMNIIIGTKKGYPTLKPSRSVG